MNQFQQLFGNFYDKYIRLYDDKYVFKNTTELYMLIGISLPISLILYMFFSKNRQKILVDLGHGNHKWLVK
jgi:hypothetical protein